MKPQHEPRPTKRLPSFETPDEKSWRVGTGLWLLILATGLLLLLAASTRAEAQPAYCADDQNTDCTSSHPPTTPAHYEEDRNRSLRDGNQGVQLAVLIAAVTVALVLVRNKF